MLKQVAIKKSADSCSWDGDPGGFFSAAAVRGWLAGRRLSNIELAIEWCKWIPDKCNIFMWRALLDHLPTKAALRRRNTNTDNSVCVFCNDGEETVDHIFMACGFATGAWEGVLRWCGLPNFFVFSVKDLMELHKSKGILLVKKEILKGMVMICCWRIWKAKNEHIFNNKRCKVVDIVADIKAYGFLWYKNRHNVSVSDWNSWCNLYLM
ncbi:uncharacterized protein LOC143591291 [Bidens hawaiensis]|uniref:uncharacterized protein LOC143591291 n=1 Tax=Bidens hawaiensis TaxID=980011 RepID=UPI0040496E68